MILTDRLLDVLRLSISKIETTREVVEEERFENPPIPLLRGTNGLTLYLCRD